MPYKALAALSVDTCAEWMSRLPAAHPKSHSLSHAMQDFEHGSPADLAASRAAEPTSSSEAGWRGAGPSPAAAGDPSAEHQPVQGNRPSSLQHVWEGLSRQPLTADTSDSQVGALTCPSTWCKVAQT